MLLIKLGFQGGVKHLDLQAVHVVAHLGPGGLHLCADFAIALSWASITSFPEAVATLWSLSIVEH